MAKIASESIDHFVLCVADAEATAAAFCALHLDMAIERFGPEGRLALHTGAQKVALHALHAFRLTPRLHSPNRVRRPSARSRD